MLERELSSGADREMRENRVAIIIFVTQLFCMLFTNSTPKISGSNAASVEWSFAAADELRKLAYVDHGSVEVVIGVQDVLSKDQAELMDLILKYEGKVVNKVSFGDSVEEAITVDVPIPLVDSFVREVQAIRASNYVEPNFRFRTQSIPNDTYWEQQWGPSKIEADYAWNLTIGDPSVLVAVVDTGVDWTHDDLSDNYVPLGYDWVYGDADPMDDNGHGTHVTGIIAAVLNNELGIAGLGQVSVMAEKGLDWKGEGYEDDLANAIVHATNQGADIISMSWGDYVDSVLIRRAITRAYSSGVLLVAAAGNDGTDQRMYPAAYDEVISVIATDQFDQPAGFTNHGQWVELSAPGVDVYSTLLNDGFGYKSGTSMAAPHVSGVAALVLSLYPEETLDDLRTRLGNTADDLGEAGFDYYYGYGRINAKKAVASLNPNIAITDVSLEKTIVGQGFDVDLYVRIVNEGVNPESLSAGVYVNDTLAQVKNITISGMGSATSMFTWDTTTYVKGNYIVSAHVQPVENESYIEDNTLVDGWVIVGLSGDVDMDHAVDIFDIVAIAGVYGYKKGDSEYISNYDINGDGQINILDIVITAGNYGQTA